MVKAIEWSFRKNLIGLIYYSYYCRLSNLIKFFLQRTSGYFVGLNLHQFHFEYAAKMNLIVNRVTFILLISLLALSFAFPQFEPLIFGGKKATENQFPFLVSLRVLKNGSFTHDCGASILSDRFLVTAAHCKKSKLNMKDYRVSVGPHTKEDQGEEYTIKQFFVHPKFSRITMRNDIALVQMEKPIRFGKTASAIEISRDFIDGKVPAIVAGWGRTEVGSIYFFIRNVIFFQEKSKHSRMDTQV